MFTTQYLSPFPGQEGAPFFDGKNVTQFMNVWEDLTINWPDEMRIRKVPLYYQMLMGKYIKTLPSFKAVGERDTTWADFKNEVLEEFRDDNEEQQKYTEGYLQRAALSVRGNGGSAEYRAFVLGVCEKAELFLGKGVISEYRRVTLFLLAFSDKVGDKLCKKCKLEKRGISDLH